MKSSNLIIVLLGLTFSASCKKGATVEQRRMNFHSITVKVKQSKNSDEQIKEYEKQELKVLEKADVSEIVYFDLVNTEGCNKSRLQYLGTIDNGEGMQLKVLTRFLVTGDEYNCNGSSSIELFDSRNVFYGQYPDAALPDAIQDGDLIYLGDGHDCEKLKNYVIKLDRKLPKQFFIPCDEIGGDICSFVKEKWYKAKI